MPAARTAVRPAAVTRLESLERTRERILAAARDAVAEGGWQAAQVAPIAARAGVATGSVYRYFESKAALYREVLDVVSRREVEVLRRIADGEGSATRRLSDAIAAFIDRAMKARRLAHALIAEPCDPEIDAGRLYHRAAITKEFTRIVRDGIESGEFVDMDAGLGAACVFGAFCEALVARIAPDAGSAVRSPQRSTAAIAKLCTRMLTRGR
jgi:AcrR family transcriptional regulator